MRDDVYVPGGTHVHRPGTIIDKALNLLAKGTGGGIWPSYQSPQC